MAEELMQFEGLPAPSHVKLNTRKETPQRTFFYEKPNGEIIACYEREAAQTSTKFKFIGSSDGTAYFNYLKTHIPPRQKVTLEEGQEILRAAFEAELAVARGNMVAPVYQAVDFDGSFPVAQRSSFRPPR